MRPITSMMAQKKISTLQGTSLSWPNAIDCYLPTQEPYQLKFFGLSSQASTPTPAAPVAVNGVTGNGKSDDGGANIQTLTLPTLHGLLSTSANYNLQVGADYYVTDTWEPEVITGGLHKSRYIKRINSKTFSGSETISFNASLTVTDVACFTYTVSDAPFSSKSMSTHFSPSIAVNTSGRGYFAYRNVYYMWIAKALLTGWDDGLTNAQKANLFKTWLAASTPTVYYVLATPITTLSDPVPVRAWRGVTNIYTTSAVQGQIKATALVPRH